MKMIGNLAIICAKRSDVTMEICNEMVTVSVGPEYDQAVIELQWDDDVAISQVIHELNFGKYSTPG